MTKRILIIGGTRNMGYYLSRRVHADGYDLTLLNRGLTKDDLPRGIHRLHADRSNHKQMRRALLAKRFDIVVDFVLYSGDQAQTAIDLFGDHVERYIAISSGQVYLVREGLDRPFYEDDYAGRLMPAPKAHSYAWEEWRYGMQKREVEDRLAEAWRQKRFPHTILRLPMVNSVRDPYSRLLNYYLRLRDGGPILVPLTPDYALNQVYALDVIEAIMRLIETDAGLGAAFNIAQDEHISHADFVSLLAEVMGAKACCVYAKRSDLVANGFLPDCSTFSEHWMSALDNSRAKTELGIRYTPLREYLAKLVDCFDSLPLTPPLTYRRRHAELQFAAELAGQAQTGAC
ncbi:MAG: epimerase [Chloroflexi bacterium]|nr:epimerase [Chloroflexota bacterium]MCY4247986.1 epimerase [Chloroflexota bacterium]